MQRKIVSELTLIVPPAGLYETHSCLNGTLDIVDCCCTADTVGANVRAECGLVDGGRSGCKGIVDIGNGGRGESAVDVTVTSSLPDHLMGRKDDLALW